MLLVQCFNEYCKKQHIMKQKNNKVENVKKADQEATPPPDSVTPDTNNTPATKMVEHEVTGKEHDHYPLYQQGIKIGDKILMPEAEAQKLEKRLNRTNPANKDTPATEGDKKE